jgi:broad-specificity NMP kinase
MQNLIDPPDDENYEPKKVKHNILGDLLDEITAEAKEEDQE